MINKKKASADIDTAAENEVLDTVDGTTTEQEWSKPDKNGVRYHVAPHGEQVRVSVLTRNGRSANVLADDEEARRKALANFVAEHTQQ